MRLSALALLLSTIGLLACSGSDSDTGGAGASGPDIFIDYVCPRAGRCLDDHTLVPMKTIM